MLNMLNINIARQQVKVLSDGICSRVFSAFNAVKQGTIIIIPKLLCIYLDTLLLELSSKAGVGCHIGHWLLQLHTVMISC